MNNINNPFPSQQLFSTMDTSLFVEVVGHLAPPAEIKKKQSFRGLGVPLHNLVLGADGIIYFKEES